MQCLLCGSLVTSWAAVHGSTVLRACLTPFLAPLHCKTVHGGMFVCAMPGAPYPQHTHSRTPFHTKTGAEMRANGDALPLAICFQDGKR